MSTQTTFKKYPIQCTRQCIAAFSFRNEIGTSMASKLLSRNKGDAHSHGISLPAFWISTSKRWVPLPRQFSYLSHPVTGRLTSLFWKSAAYFLLNPPPKCVNPFLLTWYTKDLPDCPVGFNNHCSTGGMALPYWRYAGCSAPRDGIGT